MPETYEDFENIEELNQLADDHDGVITIQRFGDKGQWKVKFVCKELDIKEQQTGKHFDRTSEILLDKVRKEMTA